MRKSRKTFVLAATVAGAVAIGSGAAIAATDGFSPGEASEAVISDAAKQLGVEPAELGDALRQALENRVDEAVAGGRLTQAQGESLKERLESADTPLLFGAFGHRTHGAGHGHTVALDAAAAFLGLTHEELRAELRDGKSLANVATANGKSVDGLVQALVTAASKRIDEDVANGKLTEARAAELKDGLESRIAELVNREREARRGFLRPGSDGFHAPRPLFGLKG